MPERTCLRILANGQRCAFPALEGSNYCGRHKPARSMRSRKKMMKKKK